MSASDLKQYIDKKAVLSNAEFFALQEQLQLTAEQLYFALLNVLKHRAIVPISQFKVAAIVVGESGALYFGCNYEFYQTSNLTCIHAEQAAVYNAYYHHETGIKKVIVNAPPCGHCRQFLNEIKHGGEIEVYCPNYDVALLKDLLPESFGPQNINGTLGLFSGSNPNITVQSAINEQDHLLSVAIKAMPKSYTPYWSSPAVVVLQMQDNRLFEGVYIENVALNPSLPPLQAAFVQMNQAGYGFAGIDKILLLESSHAPISHLAMTQDLLNSINFTGEFVAQQVDVLFVQAAAVEYA